MVNSLFFETSRPLTEKVDQYIEKSFASKKSHLGKTLNTIFQVKLCGPRWPVCSTNSINGGRACASRKLWRPELLKKPRWEALTAQSGQIPKKPARNKFKKICEIDWSCLCLQQFGKFWILMKITRLPETEIAKVSFITNIEQLKWIYFWFVKPLCTASEANREITSTAVKVRSKRMLQNLIQRKAGWIWNISKRIQAT